MSTVFFNDARAFASSFLTDFELTKEERKRLTKDNVWPDQLLILRDATKDVAIKPSLNSWVISFKTAAFSDIFHGELTRAVSFKLMNDKSATAVREQKLLETWQLSVKIVLRKWLRARRILIEI